MGIKLKAAVFLILASVTAGFAAQPFKLESGVRLGTAAVYCVTSSPNGYRMYYSSETVNYGAAGVLSAVSSDGLNWTKEAGIRISTGFNSMDASSITAMGLYYDPAPPTGVQPYKAYYVGLNSAGLYSILRATSTDGLVWGKTSSFSMQFNSGHGYVTSPSPYFMGAHTVRLHYVRDSAGGNNPANYRIYMMTSYDDGLTFSDETRILPDNVAYNIAVSTLTDGSVRMFITAPLQGGTTGAQILTALSTGGYAFYKESLAVLSTNAATNLLSGLGVVQATDTYNWRAYMTLMLGGEATSYIYSGITVAPVITGISPDNVYINDQPTTFAVSGEIFAPAISSVTISKGLNLLKVTSVTRKSDMSLSVIAESSGAALGFYDLTVINPNGSSYILPNALHVDFRAGHVAPWNNLFNPLKGAPARLDVFAFYAGNLSIKVYTVNGGFVKTIYNGPVSAGVNMPNFWSGDTESGAIVASGLYLVHIKGPKIDDTEKVVVIK